VGLPSTTVDGLQRGGRAFRVSNSTALFVVFHEAWALDIQEKDYTGDINDPDRPQKDLRASSRRQERAPLSGIRLVQSRACLRRFYADYLDDKSPEGLRCHLVLITLVRLADGSSSSFTFYNTLLLRSPQ